MTDSPKQSDDSQAPDAGPPKVSRQRDKIHEVIFGAHTKAGLTFDILLLVAIMLSVIAISLETVNPIRERWGVELTYIKWFFTGLFTVEYLLRLYCVRRPLRYAFSFWGIVDILSILPDYLLMFYTQHSLSVIRSLRLLRVFRILNLAWFQHEAEDLGNAIWNARAKIVVFLIVVLIIVTVAGSIMYEIESNFSYEDADGNSTQQIQSIPGGIYWAIVTMTTVGFGDIVPVTTGGKIISAILILIGYSLIIVPTGFVSAEVIDSKRKRRRKMSSISCASCVTQNHDVDAVHCKFCGAKL